MKITKRLSIKGIINYSEKTVTTFDKDLGELVHKFDDIFSEFENLDDVTLTLSYDHIIIPE